MNSKPCREPTCQKLIVWLPNRKTGKNVPVESRLVGPDDKEYDQRKHVNHFTTCTKPNQFSKR